MILPRSSPVGIDVGPKGPPSASFPAHQARLWKSWSKTRPNMLNKLYDCHGDGHVSGVEAIVPLGIAHGALNHSYDASN